MRTVYRHFSDARGNNIPDCTISSDKKIIVEGAFENDISDWVCLTQIDIIISKLINGLWEYYGAYNWTGKTALRANTIYDINAPSISLSKGVYGVMNFSFKTIKQESGLYYHSGNFDLEFRR